MTKQRTGEESDLRSMVYFWQEKQDLERMCGFEELQDWLRVREPALYKAWQDYKLAIAILDAVVRDLADRAGY